MPLPNPARLPALLRRIEAMGVRTKERHWALMPRELAQRSGALVERVGDGLITLMKASDSLRMNRVIGLGHGGQATESMLDEIIAYYRAARLKRFSVLMSPGPQADIIERWLVERGCQRRGGYALLLRDCRVPVPHVSSAVRVLRGRKQHAEAIVRIFERTFGGPASRRAWGLATATARGYEYELAFVGETPAAVGAMQIDEDLAWLGGGATLTPWRRHGAHSALIAARLRRATQRGCRWAWVETTAPARGRPDGSRRNLLRFGFAEACIKPIFVWKERG